VFRQAAVASSTWSIVRQGPFDRMNSVLSRPLTDSVRVESPSKSVRFTTYAGVHIRYDRQDAKRSSMSAIESGRHLARLLPSADLGTLRRLERGAPRQAFGSRGVLHARGIPLPPFVVLDGHVMDRRVAETEQVRAALIAASGRS